MLFKSGIMSKKQKLDQKKLFKSNPCDVIDLINSSEDDCSQQILPIIEKRSQYSGKPFNSVFNKQQFKPYQHKELDYSKLQSSTIKNQEKRDKIIFTSQYGTEDGEEILVVETAGQQILINNLQQRTLFSYKVQGKEGIKFVSETHIKGRINSEIKEIQKKEQIKHQIECVQLEKIMQGSFFDNSIQQSNQKARQKSDKNKDADQSLLRKRPVRYFEDVLSDQEEQENIVKCFRCYQRGHIAKNCIEEEPKQLCSFCLSEHHSSVCDSSPCFTCSKPGHISQDCQFTGIRCLKCNKKGHKSDKCGVYVPLDYHNKSEEYIKNRFKKNDLKRLKCLNSCKNPEGHFNCFSYNKKRELEPYFIVSSRSKPSYQQRKDYERFFKNKNFNRKF